jgi:elongation factor 3
VLDEPTNYLDREALGALTQAINSFAGGIIIISHNKEFTDAVCNESWLVENGTCITKGGAVEETALKLSSTSSIKKSRSASQLSLKAAKEDNSGGNTNKNIASEVILNPRTLEGLSKKETRLLTRCAETAGLSLKDYVSKLNCYSPEWKWL